MRGIPCEFFLQMTLLTMFDHHDNKYIKMLFLSFIFLELSQSYNIRMILLGFSKNFFFTNCFNLIMSSLDFVLSNELGLMLIICRVSDIISAFIAVRKRTKCFFFFFAVFSSTANKNENKSTTYFWHWCQIVRIYSNRS